MQKNIAPNEYDEFYFRPIKEYRPKLLLYYGDKRDRGLDFAIVFHDENADTWYASQPSSGRPSKRIIAKPKYFKLGNS
jgi:hypothetical protein